ncbi:LysE family translocator [Vibrio hangzhouensis]|uniref:Threonine/homoserine/homoserine lactone efflux protein n=1 Tax=Vibrio hangzhouensis TaxID=462991 RepID=A0A1H6C7K1_9VIBR|nr:LysE family translocator [Vibrio hangzhouensis]SEG68717.1 Threonine/homoserine/homoserine lactone efflux protein [Vibrio hangzhouensis]
MTFTIWLSLLTICLLGAMSPGPSLAIVAKHSLAGGRQHGLATAWAHAFGIGVYALITVLGLSVLLHQFPLLFKTISLLGALYLAWLGFNAIRSKGGIVERLESGKKVSVASAAKEGLFISLLSPKIALFFTALFSQFVAVGSELTDKAIIVTTPLIIDGLWYTLITFMLSSPRLLNGLKSKARIIDQLSGLVLILLAARVIYTL